MFKCFHQSRGPVSVFLSFAANLSIADCLALQISAVVMFRVCLYFSKSTGRFVFLYFMYKRLHFLYFFLFHEKYYCEYIYWKAHNFSGKYNILPFESVQNNSNSS